MLPVEQKIFFYIVSGSIFLLIMTLVRKRRLRENYTLLWIFISFVLILIVVEYKTLIFLADKLKATPTSLIMFCGMVALLLLILQLSLMNSSQALQIKKLAQKIALLEMKIRSKK